MTKKIIRLTESDLHRIVKESVNRILKEVKWTDSDGTTYQDQHGTDAGAWDRLANERKKRYFKSKLASKEGLKNGIGMDRDRANSFSLPDDNGNTFPRLSNNYMRNSKDNQEYLKRMG